MVHILNSLGYRHLSIHRIRKTHVHNSENLADTRPFPSHLLDEEIISKPVNPITAINDPPGIQQILYTNKPSSQIRRRARVIINVDDTLSLELLAIRRFYWDQDRQQEMIEAGNFDPLPLKKTMPKDFGVSV